MQREKTQPGERSVAPETEDTSRTHELAAPILRGLLAYPRVLRLYPTGHGRVEAQLAEIETQFAELFEHEKGPLLVSVKGAGLLINGTRLESLTETTARLAFLLRRRRIRALRLLPGLTREEIEFLAHILGTDHKEILRAGGVESFLSDKAHPHVEAMIYQFSLGTGSGDGGLGSLAKARLPSQILEKIEAAVTAPQFAERLETIRDAFVEKLLAAGVTAEIEVGVFDELISNFFARPEWANLPVERIREPLDWVASGRRM